jgi:hypothetical protein
MEDPSLPAHRIVTDIDKAPRNANGKVEFSSDFFLIKPKRIERIFGVGGSRSSVSLGTTGFNELNPLAATVFRAREYRALWMACLLGGPYRRRPNPEV